MSTVINLFVDEEPAASVPAKFGYSFLEFMQEPKQEKRYAPTVQVHSRRLGEYVDYRPHNPLAKLMAKLVNREVLTEFHLGVIEEMGMNVEILA
jgi:hypothetical protein